MNIFQKLFGKSEPAQLYRLIPPESHDVLGPWAPEFPAYQEVVGYSSLGHIFLRDPNAQSYAVLYPFKGAAKSYGGFESISDFEEAVLKEPGFEETVLRPAHVQTIEKRLGALGKDEVYVPQPYPFLGGSEGPNTYEKGNVWIFTHIVGQMGGLGSGNAT
jgi:hypothetical protein